MVIVLLVAFSLLTVLLVWLKRRHDAKYPHLYHANSKSASRTSSGPLLNARPHNSTPALSPFSSHQQHQPGAFDPHIGVTMAEPRRLDGANTDSFASSARTAVNSHSRSVRSPTRLAQGRNTGDLEIQEMH